MGARGAIPCLAAAILANGDGLRRQRFSILLDSLAGIWYTATSRSLSARIAVSRIVRSLVFLCGPARSGSLTSGNAPGWPGCHLHRGADLSLRRGALIADDARAACGATGGKELL